MEAFLAERAPEVAFYSEDRGHGLAGRRRAEWVLVVDPIDGTRPALAGLESALRLGRRGAARWRADDGRRRGRLHLEIKSGEALRRRARSGPGAGAAAVGEPPRLERMFWTYGLRGRPARALIEVLAELIDASSVGGGTFDLGSATFDMTRIVTGQLDAYVEPGPRMVDDVPGMRAEFERVGGGAVLNNSPYDLAAAALCLRRPGRSSRDAYGEPLGRPPAARLGPRLPDVLRRRRERRAPRRRSAPSVDAGIERLAPIRITVLRLVRACLKRTALASSGHRSCFKR